MLDLVGDVSVAIGLVCGVTWQYMCIKLAIFFATAAVCSMMAHVLGLGHIRSHMIKHAQALPNMHKFNTAAACCRSNTL